MNNSSKTYPILFAILFMAWLLTPWFLDTIPGKPEKSISARENRALSKRPVFHPLAADVFPSAYDNFYTDLFPYREELINWWSRNVNIGIYRKSPPNSEVDIGLDGWLFNSTERPYYEGTKMYGPDTIELIHQTIRNRVIFYKASGIRLYILFPPVKDHIYPEYLPPDYLQPTDSTLTEKVISVLLKDTLIPFVNVTPALLNAKNNGRLYSKTDNHWNTKGGYEAYYQLICRIKKDFPSVKPVERKDVAFIPNKLPGGNLALKLGIAEYTTEEYFKPVLKVQRARDGKKAGYKAPPWFHAPDDFEHVKVVADSSLPKVVVIRDSFFIQMMPFFEENFRKTVYLFDAWMYELNWDIIQKEKPDIVVLEVVEPNIKSLIRVYQ
jgi:alginate O-acetyltransferase complex protein AlgJ